MPQKDIFMLLDSAGKPIRHKTDLEHVVMMIDAISDRKERKGLPERDELFLSHLFEILCENEDPEDGEIWKEN